MKLKSLCNDLLYKIIALATSSVTGNNQHSVKWKHRKTNVRAHKFLTPHKILKSKQQLLNQPPNLTLFYYIQDVMMYLNDNHYIKDNKLF